MFFLSFLPVCQLAKLLMKQRRRRPDSSAGVGVLVKVHFKCKANYHQCRFCLCWGVMMTSLFFLCLDTFSWINKKEKRMIEMSHLHHRFPLQSRWFELQIFLEILDWKQILCFACICEGFVCIFWLFNSFLDVQNIYTLPNYTWNYSKHLNILMANTVYC